MNIRTLQKLVDTSFDLIHLPETINKHLSYLLLRSTVISIGWSQLKTHPVALKHNFKWGCLHSELDCLRKSPILFSSLNRCTLVNIRVNSLGEVCNSRPCKLCVPLVESAQLKAVYFTNSDGSFSKLGT